MYMDVDINDNIWFGSLDFIEPERGYWLRVENPDSLELITYESPSDLIYNLHYPFLSKLF